ncbi:MAG: dTDP-4-amino-4,6-dideoxygalactose transaminase [Bacteroidota bacterium]
MRIPFHRPFYDAADEQALVSAIRSGRIVGDGLSTEQASRELERLLGARHVLLTPSCTHALELALLALGVGGGDEVIVPSFTFVSSTNCIMLRGARPVFADVSPDTLTIRPEEVERRWTPRTRAVMPVAYAGVAPPMDEITEAARLRGGRVVEDAAQGIGAFYRGRALGSVGDAGAISFHETKNISTGEGGAFITQDEEIAAAAEIIREKGTNRKQFLVGLTDKYTWVGVGSSYLAPDLTAALLLSQLAKLPGIIARRRELFGRYRAALEPLATEGKLALPVIPAGVESNYHIFHVLVENEETRNKGIAFFRARGIGTAFHYLPLHLSPVGRSLGYGPGDFPVTESVSGRLLRLPLYPSLTDAEQEEVIGTMKEFLR